MDVRKYARAFDQVERDYEHAVAAFGVPFEASESCPRSRRAEVAAACSCHCENGEGSLWRGWISPACSACRKGGANSDIFYRLALYAELLFLLQSQPGPLRVFSDP